MKKIFSFVLVVVVMFVFSMSSYAGDMHMAQTVATWTIRSKNDSKSWSANARFYYEIDYVKNEIVGGLNLPEYHAEFPQYFPEQALYVGPYTKGKTKLVWVNPGNGYISGYIDAVIP